MSDAAPMNPTAEQEPQRPMRPGTVSVPDQPVQAPVETTVPDNVKVVRPAAHMLEVWIDNALIGVAQATSTAEGPWEFRYMPGWKNREDAERHIVPMCLAAVGYPTPGR